MQRQRVHGKLVQTYSRDYSQPMTRHCFKCGKDWTPSNAPGRRDACEACNTYLRCCRNCVHFDVAVAHQCRERRAEPVDEKDRANYCEYFDFARRNFKKTDPSKGEISREEAAKDTLRKLLGD